MSVTSRKRQPPAERRSAILQAAGEVFFTQGYAATSIDAIIERLGGSKRAIYQEFGSKEGLFVALVSESANVALAALDGSEVASRDLRGTLIAFGRELMHVLLAPGLIGAYRAIMSEALRFPDLAHAFYTNGPGRAQMRLAEVLEAAQGRGELRATDCSSAASHLLGMLRDNLHLRVVLGLCPPPTKDELDAFVASVIDLFLHGVGTLAQQHARTR